MIQPNISSFLTILIAAPLLEEVFFRGILLEGFLKNYSPAKAITWSALIFGMVHLNPWQAIGATVDGLLIGWLYWRTNSLIPGLIIHMFNNLIGFFTGMFHGILLVRGIDFISISLAIVITILTVSGILIRYAKLRIINQFNRIIHTHVILSALLVILIILHVLIS